MALTDRGFTIHQAASGKEAIELLRRLGSLIGVALLDVLMPRMDGPTTLRELRKLDPDLPACFYTAYAGNYSDTELLAPGRCAILTKPCPLDKLAATLTALLQSKDPTSSA